MEKREKIIFFTVIFFIILISTNYVSAHSGSHPGCFENGCPSGHATFLPYPYNCPWTDSECATAVGLSNISSCDVRYQDLLNFGGTLAGSIEVCNHNRIIDCNQNQIISYSTGGYTAISSIEYNNILIQNCEIKNFNQGIVVSGSFITIKKNNIVNNMGMTGEGIFFLDSSANVIIEQNNISNNRHGIIRIAGVVIENLTIKENVISYNLGTGINIDANATIKFNNITNNKWGILATRFNNITNNNISFNYFGGVNLFGAFNYFADNTLEGNFYGIKANGDNNSIIGNNIIKSNESGIFFDVYTKSNKVINNNITWNNKDGIIFKGSSSNTVLGNKMSYNNNSGVYIFAPIFALNFFPTVGGNNSIIYNNISHNNDSGIIVHGTLSNNISLNTISNNLKKGILISPMSDIGYFNIIIAENISLFLNNISNNGLGIFLNYTNHTNVIGNKISNNNQDGIYLENSPNNLIINNSIKENKLTGIKLQSSKNNNILNNNITSNEDGIFLTSGINNTISNNFIFSNKKSGIIITNILPINLQFENIIKENIILNNTDGIKLDKIINSTIKNNYICLNKIDINNGTLTTSQVRGIDNTCATVINFTDQTMVLNLSLCALMCQCWDTDNNNNPDNDGDALCDNWEDLGIDADNNTVIDLNLPAMGSNKNYKDLFLEIDYMQTPAHNHMPIPAGLNRVRNAFLNSPVQNPNGTKGINFHILVDESMPEIANINFRSGLGSPHFNDIKLGNLTKNCDGNFGTLAERISNNCENILESRKWSIRYNLFGHNYEGGTSSGVAELPGNDFFVSLGSFTANIGNQMEQESTLMHEFGHTLNLKHGGIDSINCKPNYLSIMSYSFQFNRRDPNRPLDYSNQTLPTLNESFLNENLGIQGPSTRHVVFGNHTTGNLYLTLPLANNSIDWNGNGTIDPLATISGINPDSNFIASIRRCDIPSQGQILNGFSDWQNLIYNFRLSPDFADGSQITVPDEPELSPENITLPYNLTLEDSPNITATVNFTIYDPAHSGFPYVFAFSLGTNPGVQLPTGQTIPLNYDSAMEISLFYPQLINLINSTGNLDHEGKATVFWTIPNAPIAGLQLYAGAITLTPSAQIARIFTPVNFTIVS